MKTKKRRSFLLALIVLLSLLSGCGKGKESTLPVHVQGSIFGGNGTDSIALELKYNPDWLTKSDNTIYNKDIAAFCALISADSYFREKDLARGTPNRVLIDGCSDEEYDKTVLLSSLGFADVRTIESFSEKSYETDTNDIVTMTLAYAAEGRKYDIFVIAVRGCFSASEWYSICDVGASGNNYTAYSGEHGEWSDTRQLKGIAVSTARAEELVREYIADHDDNERENIILVTGHSRGGAVAEILGAHFEDETDTRSYTYTFNSTPVTSDENAPNYKTIFNIFDSGDFFTDFYPFSGEKLYRYGKNLSLSVAERKNIQDRIAELKGADDYRSGSSEQAERYAELYGKLFPDRASLYAPLSIFEHYESREEAETTYQELSKLISAENGLGLETFCALSEIKEENGDFGFELSYCRGAWMLCVGKVLAYGQSAADEAKILFPQKDFCALVDFIMENAGIISSGHRLLNSYVLCNFLG